MIDKVLEEMRSIKYLYDKSAHTDIDDCFDNVEQDVLSYMRTLGEVSQKYSHKYGCRFWCKASNIEVNISIDDKLNMIYSVARYGQEPIPINEHPLRDEIITFVTSGEAHIS